VVEVDPQHVVVLALGNGGLHAEDVGHELRRRGQIASIDGQVVELDGGVVFHGQIPWVLDGWKR